MKKTLKKQIRELSEQNQKPFAGLMEELQHQHRVRTSTAGDMLQVIQDIATGAEADTTDGLKTRTKRLENLRKHLLKVGLQGQEKITVYRAFVKVQKAVKERERQAKRTLGTLSNMTSEIGGNILQATEQAMEEFPLFKAGIMATKFFHRHIKSAQQKKAQAQLDRNQALKKDAEQFYKTELQRPQAPQEPAPGMPKPVPPVAGPPGKRPRAPKRGKAPKEEGFFPGSIPQEPLGSLGEPVTVYDRNTSSPKARESDGDKTLKIISADVKKIVKYLDWKKIQDKDSGLDNLEGSRETSFGAKLKKALAEGPRGLVAQEQGSSGGTLSNIADIATVASLVPGSLRRAKTLGGKAITGARNILGRGAGWIGRGAGLAAGALGAAGLLSGAKNLGGGIVKGAGKVLGGTAVKAGGKSLLKKIPGVSLIAGGLFAGSRALQGDFSGAAMELASGAAGTIPGLGTAASVGLDAALLAKDAGAFSAAGPAVAGASPGLFKRGISGAGRLIKAGARGLTRGRGLLAGGLLGGLGVSAMTNWMSGDNKPKDKWQIKSTAFNKPYTEKTAYERAQESRERNSAQERKLKKDDRKLDAKEYATELVKALAGDSFLGKLLNMLNPLGAISGGLSKVGSWFSGGSSGSSSGGSGGAPSAAAALNPTSKVRNSFAGGGSSSFGDSVPGGDELGSLSAKYESGRKGSVAVGFDPKGGTSYGKYQIATRTGTMNKFMEYLKESNPSAYQRLAAAGPADSGKDGRFAQEWKALAQEGVLGNSEHDFIKKTHYDVGMKGVQNQELQKMLGSSKALQDVMWSTSVQHGAGAASKMFDGAYKEGMSEQDLIKAVYAKRRTKFGGSPRDIQQGVMNRFDQEQAQAIGMSLNGTKQPELRPDVSAPQMQQDRQIVATPPKAPIQQAAAPIPVPAAQQPGRSGGDTGNQKEEGTNVDTRLPSCRDAILL